MQERCGVKKGEGYLCTACGVEEINEERLDSGGSREGYWWSWGCRGWEAAPQQRGRIGKGRDRETPYARCGSICGRDRENGDTIANLSCCRFNRPRRWRRHGCHGHSLWELKEEKAKKKKKPTVAFVATAQILMICSSSGEGGWWGWWGVVVLLPPISRYHHSWGAPYIAHGFSIRGPNLDFRVYLEDQLLYPYFFFFINNSYLPAARILLSNRVVYHKKKLQWHYLTILSRWAIQCVPVLSVDHDRPRWYQFVCRSTVISNPQRRNALVLSSIYKKKGSSGGRHIKISDLTKQSRLIYWLALKSS